MYLFQIVGVLNDDTFGDILMQFIVFLLSRNVYSFESENRMTSLNRGLREIGSERSSWQTFMKLSNWFNLLRRLFRSILITWAGFC